MGDRILIRRTGFKGPHKLEDRWSRDVYLVKEQPDQTIPVYRVHLESETGPVKTLHRNLLLPIGQIFHDDSFDLHATESHKPLTRSKRKTPVLVNYYSTSD